jgi:hypothetical protein
MKCSYSPCFVCAGISCQKLSPHLAPCDFLSFTELQLMLKEQIFNITAIKDKSQTVRSSKHRTNIDASSNGRIVTYCTPSQGNNVELSINKNNQSENLSIIPHKCWNFSNWNLDNFFLSLRMN